MNTSISIICYKYKTLNNGECSLMLRITKDRKTKYQSLGAIERGMRFSMVSIKTVMHNTFLMQRFIRVSGIKPNKRLNDKLFKEFIVFAAIAA